MVGRVGVLAGVEVGGGGGSAVRSGVGSDGCGEVDMTAELDVALEVAKTGGGKKSARGGGVLKRVPLYYNKGEKKCMQLQQPSVQLSCESSTGSWQPQSQTHVQDVKPCA